MLFVLHALDKADAAGTRQTHYAAHRAHIANVGSFGVKIVMSGPLLAEDGKVIGSHLVLEAHDLAAVTAFYHADPFYKADIWQNPTLALFDKKVG